MYIFIHINICIYIHTQSKHRQQNTHATSPTLNQKHVEKTVRKKRKNGQDLSQDATAAYPTPSKRLLIPKFTSVRGAVPTQERGMENSMCVCAYM